MFKFDNIFLRNPSSKNISKNDTIFMEDRLNNCPWKKLKSQKPTDLFANSIGALGP